jgi:transposase
LEVIMRKSLFWLSEAQWARIAPHLPTDVRGVPREDDRRVISGIIHVLKTGCRWCDCPREYGPYTTIYNRFVRWAERGVWDVRGGVKLPHSGGCVLHFAGGVKIPRH